MEERKNAEIHRKSKEERAQKALEDEETLMSIEEKESNNLNVEVETFAQVQFHVFFFFQKNTPFISYKVLQKSYVQIPVGMR